MFHKHMKCAGAAEFGQDRAEMEENDEQWDQKNIRSGPAWRNLS